MILQVEKDENWFLSSKNVRKSVQVKKRVTKTKRLFHAEEMINGQYKNTYRAVAHRVAFRPSSLLPR